MKSVQGEPGHSAAAAAAAPRRDMTASDDEWEHMPQQVGAGRLHVQLVGGVDGAAPERRRSGS